MNLFPSVMRTIIPIIVGWLLTATDALGVPLDSTSAATAVTAAVTAVYYLAFRLIEEGANRFNMPTVRAFAGILLGWARPPQYPANAKKADAATTAVREEG